MQKISNLSMMATILFLNCTSVCAQTGDSKTIKQSDLETCFSQVERLMRLECYDELFERPQLASEIQGQVVPPKEPERVARLPTAIAYAIKLMASKDSIGEQVKVSVLDRASGEPFKMDKYVEEGLIGYINSPQTPKEYKSFTLENDLFLAIESDPEIGDAATMVVSCENNISRLKFIFSQSFEGKFVEARFYSSVALTHEAALQRKLRVRQDGYLLENARGLDAIRLISRLVAGDYSQIAVGNGERIRSAFFETDSLKKALPLLAKHCSWSRESSK